MELLEVVAFTTIVVSGNTLTGVAPQWGGSHYDDDGNYGPSPSMSIYQFGSSNVVNALQSNAYRSDMTITQYEHGNGTAVGRDANDSTTSLKWTGSQNSVTIDQWNAESADISVTQLDGHNDAVVGRTAPDSDALIRQADYGNNATADQH